MKGAGDGGGGRGVGHIDGDGEELSERAEGEVATGVKVEENDVTSGVETLFSCCGCCGFCGCCCDGCLGEYPNWCRLRLMCELRKAFKPVAVTEPSS